MYTVQIHSNHLYNSINHKQHAAYTGDGESKNSGCNLCRSIPQRGQKGFGVSSWTEDSIKDLKSSGYLGIVNKDSAASLEVHLWQHLQNHRGVAGQTCMDTEHLTNLCFWLSPSLLSKPRQTATSGESKGTDAVQ